MSTTPCEQDLTLDHHAEPVRVLRDLGGFDARAAVGYISRVRFWFGKPTIQIHETP